MTDREKLWKLIADAQEKCNARDCDACDYRDKEACFSHLKVDHLIANGVVVREKGEWIEKEDWNVDDYYYTCSVCKEDFVTIDGEPMRSNFCPNCGSDMRKGENG